jgi:hypothetical protein
MGGFGPKRFFGIISGLAEMSEFGLIFCEVPLDLGQFRRGAELG